MDDKPVIDYVLKELMTELSYMSIHLGGDEFRDVVDNVIESLSENPDKKDFEECARDLGRVYHHLSDLKHGFFAMKALRCVGVLIKLLNGQEVTKVQMNELTAVV